TKTVTKTQILPTKSMAPLLDVDIWYQGKIIELSGLRPSPEELCEHPEALVQLAGFLIRQFADKVNVQEKDGSCHLRLHFEH
ncbi:MAG: hypothetical protein JSU72_08290, partial [Deltaproteobacteria bacterium]